MQGSQSNSSLPFPVGGQPLTDTVLGDVTERRELRQLRQQADALAQVVASVTASPASLEQTLPALAQSVVQATGIVACGIVLVEQGAPHIAGTSGMPDGYMAGMSTIWQNRAQSSNVWAPGWERLLIVRNFCQTFLSNPLYAPIHDYLRTVNWETMVRVPLIYQDRVLGFLAGYYPQGTGPSDTDITFLITVTNHAAIAVEHARLLAQAQREAALQERQRLARELHDSVTQSLYSLTLLAEAGRRLAEAGDLEHVQGYLSRLGETAQQSLKEMRLLVYELRPSALEHEGLVGALQQRLETVEQRAGMQTQLLVEGEWDMPTSQEAELYRIAVEALNNTLRHAQAATVTVRIRANAQAVEVEIADDGQGFDRDGVDGKGGMGLLSMRERAERLGGSLTILSTPGQGTRIHVHLGGRTVPGSAHRFKERNTPSINRGSTDGNHSHFDC